MPPRGRKRKSEQSVASEADHAPSTSMATEPAMAATTPKRTWTTVATKLDSSEESSPRKKQRTAVTLAQKQALIDNLQLEVTERARKLRAQYHLQAQGLRTRIEIRVNRIPTALRKATMGDLLLKHAAVQPKSAVLKKTAYSSGAPALAPPVPEKDYFPGSSLLARGASPARAAVGRAPKYFSDNMASGDKENQGVHLENPKMRPRANYAGAATAAGNGQVLSPASSNARVNPGARERAAASAPSPAKSLIARPMSPTKQQAQAATNLLSAMVDKARGSRTGTARKLTAPAAAAAAAANNTGRAQASRAPSRAAGSRAPSRMAKRTSGISESSEASTSTVVRKVGRPPGRAGVATRTTAPVTRKVVGTAAAGTSAAPAPKKATVMSSIKKGAMGASTKRAATAAANTTSKAGSATPAASATTRSGRVLRKRD